MGGTNAAAVAITVLFNYVNIPSNTSEVVAQLGHGNTPTYMSGRYTGSATVIYPDQTFVTPHQNGFGICRGSTASGPTAYVTSVTDVMIIALFDPATNTRMVHYIELLCSIT